MNHKEYRYIVSGNGNQAPYGINERIDSYPCTPQGLKKAKKLAMMWHNPATIKILTPMGVGIFTDINVWDIDHNRIKQTYNIG